MKLKLERNDATVELARLQGRELEDHEGYPRDNNGDWVILWEDGGRMGTVCFMGKAKRGEAYRAPDPEGLAIARRLVSLWNQQE